MEKKKSFRMCQQENFSNSCSFSLGFTGSRVSNVRNVCLYRLSKFYMSGFRTKCDFFFFFPPWTRLCCLQHF